MKRGYHSVQERAFHAIPRSEFIGLALGFAIGSIAHGILKMDGLVLEVAGTAAGFAIGVLIDRLLYLEKDVPEQEPTAVLEGESETREHEGTAKHR